MRLLIEYLRRADEHGWRAWWRRSHVAATRQSINQAIKNSISTMLLSVCLSILSASRGGCCGMVAARFSPALSGMIEGISAGAHEIERHDRSPRDIDLVVWCLVGGEIGARCDFGGKVLPLFFPLSLALLLLACCSLASPLSLLLLLSCSLRLRQLTHSPLAPVVCISHSSNPPLLVPLVRCCELVVAAPSLSLSRWFGSISHTRYAIGTLLVGRSARGISLISCLYASLLAIRRETSSLPLFAMGRRKSKSKATLGE